VERVAVDDLDLPFAVTQIGIPDGIPVIVLPGGPCRGIEYLGDLAGLTRTYNLVVLHPRGTPLSGGLSRGWWADADDVVALADALGLRQVSVVAHSAATRLALAVAARFPDRLQSLTLVTPPASWLSGTIEDAGAVELDREDPEVADALEALKLEDPDTDEAFVSLFRRQAPATYAHWTRREHAHAGLGVMNLAAASAWFTDIPVDVVSRIRGAVMPPTLVIGGGGDVLTGRQPVVDYARALHAELEVIDDCGHYPWVEQPDAFYRIMDGWLTDTVIQRRGPANDMTAGTALPD
jgi:pimeloyl-ACP methyl ester carboxylesterase